ncbi:unnamed protein product [Microthlaspi erraticum]|uniref:SBP-type domain-containing protein n=1 Tax=Microthlaspi erraticum TaxID=1685480 RepID=A0A6D2L7U0_9BRAS|nr:unnamed protein product [Microthlaspi erraticum]
MELLMDSSQTESGGSSSIESSSLTGGLRFGQKIYFEDGSGSGAKSSKNRVNTARKSSTSTARCQVEGCRMDLSNAKTYYSRHKVCCIHSKSSNVIVSGLHQRFHLLSEFDLEKRSCRRRLACHNERRRKPHATTNLLTSRYSRIAPSLYENANTAIFRSVLGDTTAWSAARPVMRRSGPWQINPERESNLNVFSHGSSSFTTCPAMMNNNSTDSSCALSLLSNSNTNTNQQQQQPLQTSTDTWRPSSGFDSMIADRVTMAQPPPVSIHNQYLNQSWDFMEGEKSNSHHMSPVLGLSQISEPADFQLSNGMGGGFELSLHQQVLKQYMEPENTRAYDSSPQHFNWSL